MMRYLILFLMCSPAMADDYIKARIAIALKLKQTVKAAPAKKRQIEFWTAKWCKTCELMKKDIADGKWAEYDIIVRDYDTEPHPENMTWLPAIRWQTPTGWLIYPHDGLNEAQYDLKTYKRMLEPVVPAPAPKKTVVRVPLKNLAGG